LALGEEFFGRVTSVDYASGKQIIESKEQPPKALFAIDFKPTAKLAQFSIEMRNVVGALQEQTDSVGKHGVNILSGFHDAPMSAETGVWSFFADFTNADIEPEALATELSSHRSALKVRCKRSDDGFITDTMHFPVLVGKERAIIVRAPFLMSTLARIKSIFGPESRSAQVILHQIGEAGAQSVFESVRNMTSRDFVRNNVARALSLFTSVGWGILDLKTVNLDTKTAEIHIKDGFESANSRNTSTAAQCHFIRGMLTGWFSELFGRKIGVTETECIAKGDSVCIFLVRPNQE
jgi:predicted hydrocarbon binding protein